MGLTDKPMDLSRRTSTDRAIKHLGVAFKNRLVAILPCEKHPEKYYIGLHKISQKLKCNFIKLMCFGPSNSSSRSFFLHFSSLIKYH